MNRYEKLGVALDLSMGRTIIICADSVYSHHAAMGMLELLDNIERNKDPDLLAAPELKLKRVIRSYGRESIEVASGGRVLFARSIDALRGHTAHRVLISHRVRESPGFRKSMGWLENALNVTKSIEGSSIEQLSG